MRERLLAEMAMEVLVQRTHAKVVTMGWGPEGGRVGWLDVAGG